MGEGRGVRGEWPEGRSRWARGEGRGARGEGRGAKGQGRRLAAVHAAFIRRGKRHAEQVASAEQVACLLYWFLGHAVWL